MAQRLTLSYLRLHETYSKTRSELFAKVFRKNTTVRNRSIVFTTPVYVRYVHSVVNVRSNRRDISSDGRPHRRTALCSQNPLLFLHVRSLAYTMTSQIYLRHVWCAVKFKDRKIFFSICNVWDACEVRIRVILSDARFNVVHNMRTSFAAGSTRLRTVYSICSKTYCTWSPHNREQQRRSRLVHRCNSQNLSREKIFTISIRDRLQ